MNCAVKNPSGSPGISRASRSPLSVAVTASPTPALRPTWKRAAMSYVRRSPTQMRWETAAEFEEVTARPAGFQYVEKASRLEATCASPMALAEALLPMRRKFSPVSWARAGRTNANVKNNRLIWRRCFISKWVKVGVGMRKTKS